MERSFGPFVAHSACHPYPDQTMSAFGTFLIGFLVLIVGLGIAAFLLNVPTMWIAVGVIILVGIGILIATSRTKMKDPPST